MEVGNSKFGLYWVADESDKFQSGKIAGRSLDILSDYVEQYDSLTKSRVAGIAIQFVSPPEHLAEWEESVEQRFEDSPVATRDLQDSAIPLKNKNPESVFAEANANLVSQYEYGDINNKQIKISLPKSVIESVEESCDEFESYNRRQKARFIANAILAWDASRFSDVAERIRTKEQLLTASRGEAVDDPTPAFEYIQQNEDSVLHEYAQNEAANEEMEFTNIGPTDDVTLAPDEEPVWSELGQTKGDRLGPFMAVLRYHAETAEDGFTEEQLINMFEGRNSEDYDHPDRFVQSYVLDLLHEGVDGFWNVREENAVVEEGTEEAEEKKAELKADIKAIAPTNSAIGSEVESVAGSDAVVKRGNSTTVLPDETLDNLTVDELGEVLEIIEDKV